MTEEGSSSSMDTEARKAALEIVATLVYVKKIAADRLLRPASIPDDLIKRFPKARMRRRAMRSQSAKRHR